MRRNHSSIACLTYIDLDNFLETPLEDSRDSPRGRRRVECRLELDGTISMGIARETKSFTSRISVWVSQQKNWRSHTHGRSRSRRRVSLTRAHTPSRSRPARPLSLSISNSLVCGLPSPSTYPTRTPPRLFARAHNRSAVCAYGRLDATRVTSEPPA